MEREGMKTGVKNGVNQLPFESVHASPAIAIAIPSAVASKRDS